MDIVSQEVAQLLAAKEARRRKLAELPFPDKVRVVMRLQRMVEPLLRARKAGPRVGDRRAGRSSILAIRSFLCPGPPLAIRHQP